VSAFRRFQQVVERDPQAVAVRHSGRACTYAELEARAAAVARTLVFLERQSGPSAVAVFLGDDPVSEIAAILGVTSAGGVAVPLETSQPIDRMRRLLDNCQPSAILTGVTGRSFAAELGERVPVIEVSGQTSTRRAAPVASAQVDHDQPAYICYTSGSTGEPKGVVITHRQLWQRVEVGVDQLNFNAADRHTLLHSLEVGAGCATLWRALFTGGTLLPRRVQEEGVSGMTHWLENEGATILFCSPTLFRAFVATLAPSERLSTLRMLRLGGERVSLEDFRRFKRHLEPGALFVNAYSITEASNITLHVLDHNSAVDVDDDPIPVGRALPGCHITILGGDGGELPIGEIGEIAVESPFLSAGYWRLPDSVAFEEIDKGSGAVRLHTGDCGYLRPDGVLIHTGRADFQVKVRGHRVELEGIEAALLRAPGVRRCAVLAARTIQDEITLVAYLAVDRALTDEARVRAFAASQLASAGVPGQFVLLDELPLTASGKVDRQALAALTDRRASNASPPDWSDRSRREQEVAQIWRGVLGHDRFGPDDDFLLVGGDSLLAMRAINRLRQQFQIDIPLRDIFDSRTVATVAALIDRLDRNRQLAAEKRQG
jgi:amino acid adenylation domain-containing protein